MKVRTERGKLASFNLRPSITFSSVCHRNKDQKLNGAHGSSIGSSSYRHLCLLVIRKQFARPQEQLGRWAVTALVTDTEPEYSTFFWSLVTNRDGTSTGLDSNTDPRTDSREYNNLKFALIHFTWADVDWAIYSTRLFPPNWRLCGQYCPHLYGISTAAAGAADVDQQCSSFVTTTVVDWTWLFCAYYQG